MAGRYQCGANEKEFQEQAAKANVVWRTVADERCKQVWRNKDEMIKVKIELWPGGRPAGKKELGEINISNTGGSDHPDGPHIYDIVLRDYPSMDVVHGEVIHDRKQSVWILLQKALNSIPLPLRADFSKR